MRGDAFIVMVKICIGSEFGYLFSVLMIYGLVGWSLGVYLLCYRAFVHI